MKITIVVPCYNSMKYLEQSIISVLEQDYEECIICAYDNESTDGTYEYLLELEKLKPLEEILTNALKSNSYSGNSYSGGSGKYQISTSAWDNEVFITIFNTETGKLISNSRVSMKSGYESIQDMNRMIEDAFRK